MPGTLAGDVVGWTLDALKIGKDGEVRNVVTSLNLSPFAGRLPRCVEHDGPNLG